MIFNTQRESFGKRDIQIASKAHKIMIKHISEVKNINNNIIKLHHIFIVALKVFMIPKHTQRSQLKNSYNIERKFFKERMEEEIGILYQKHM